METKVLTQEEITNLKLINEKRAKLAEHFGIVETRIQEFNIQKELYKTELSALIQEENKLGKDLQQKYGNGSIDLSKGIFISN